MAIIVLKTFNNGYRICKTIGSNREDKWLLEVATGAIMETADVLATVNEQDTNIWREVDKPEEPEEPIIDDLIEEENKEE